MSTSPSDSLASNFAQLTASFSAPENPSTIASTTPPPAKLSATASTTTPPAKLSATASSTSPATADSNSHALSTTLLSKHIENRLDYVLRKEVPGAEPVMIRVISSVDGALKVTEEIRSHFSYPNEFPYKSKFLLAFQKLSGKDVPVFGMFVEEFGVDSPSPNKLTANISYIESTKLFCPHPLRTLVFQEILIGYMEFLQKRGFKSCFIWACPPKTGEFYIFYKCAATKQHTMESLRNWYFDMLKKAKEEGIVKDFKSLVDFIFDPNSKITIRKARLLYDNAGLMYLVEYHLSEMKEL